MQSNLIARNGAGPANGRETETETKRRDRSNQTNRGHGANRNQIDGDNMAQGNREQGSKPVLEALHYHSTHRSLRMHGISRRRKRARIRRALTSSSLLALTDYLPGLDALSRCAEPGVIVAQNVYYHCIHTR